jgi:hypothetical protein
MPRSYARPALLVPAAALGILFISGCGSVEQTMTIDSNPPGALVYMNDQEIGRTPVTRDFTWHGNYDVELRKDGYEPLKTHKWVVAPKWNWVPADLFVNILPLHLHEHQHLSFTLQPVAETAVQPDVLMARAEEMRAQLESSKFTAPPATRPATPRTVTTRPVKTATTQPARM